MSWLVFDAEAVTHVDSTGLEALDQARPRTCREEQITLVVARLRTRMEEQFEHAGVTATIGRERFYPTVRAAVEACAVDPSAHVANGVRGVSTPRQRVLVHHRVPEINPGGPMPSTRYGARP